MRVQGKEHRINMAKEILIANPKGGAGKTTIATNLACYYAQLGLNTALLDFDNQASSTDWFKMRPAEAAQITSYSCWKNPKYDLNQFDVIVGDFPAGWKGDLLISHCHHADALLIPMLPSSTDIRSAVRFLMELNKYKILSEDRLKVGIIANRVRPHTKAYNTLIAFLKQINLPLIATFRDTQNYVQAIESGISIFDLPPSKVKKDLKQWQSLTEWLHA